MQRSCLEEYLLTSAAMQANSMAILWVVLHQRYAKPGSHHAGRCDLNHAACARAPQWVLS